MISTILVGLDGSVRAPDVLAAALELAERFGARIIPFRAVTIPPEFPPAAHVPQRDGLPDFLDRAAEADLLALLARAGARHEPPVIAHGQAWRALLLAAERHDVDLIVIGSHGYHGLDYVLGTTAAKVVDFARRNVLVVHTGDRTRKEDEVAAPEPGPQG